MLYTEKYRKQGDKTDVNAKGVAFLKKTCIIYIIM